MARPGGSLSPAKLELLDSRRSCPDPADLGLDREEMRVLGQDVGRELLQRPDVGDVGPAAVGGDDEVGLPRVDLEVVDRLGRQVRLQLQPGLAAVEGDIDAEIGPGEQRPWGSWGPRGRR